MTTRLPAASALLALIATGLLAGFFYAYPSSVSPGLGDLPDPGYVAGMQTINEAVPNGLFVLGFVGAPLLLALATLLHGRERLPGFVPLAAAAALVVVGGLLVTFAASVPLNDELAAVDPGAGAVAIAQARADYEDAWNAWNAVRVVSCTAALGCVGWALLRS